MLRICSIASFENLVFASHACRNSLHEPCTVASHIPISSRPNCVSQHGQISYDGAPITSIPLEALVFPSLSQAPYCIFSLTSPHTGHTCPPVVVRGTGNNSSFTGVHTHVYTTTCFIIQYLFDSRPPVSATPGQVAPDTPYAVPPDAAWSIRCSDSTSDLRVGAGAAGRSGARGWRRSWARGSKRGPRADWTRSSRARQAAWFEARAGSGLDTIEPGSSRGVARRAGRKWTGHD